jgi:hypothetical protein
MKKLIYPTLALVFAFSPIAIAEDTPQESEEYCAEGSFCEPNPADHYRYVCRVQNGRGQIFIGRGRTVYRATEKARAKCYSVSRVCRKIGCRINEE